MVGTQHWRPAKNDNTEFRVLIEFPDCVGREHVFAYNEQHIKRIDINNGFQPQFRFSCIYRMHSRQRNARGPGSSHSPQVDVGMAKQQPQQLFAKSRLVGRRAVDACFYHLSLRLIYWGKRSAKIISVPPILLSM